MNQGILSWHAFIVYGILLFGFGLFGPDFVLWGALFNLWMLLAGIALFIAGFAMAFVLVLTGRMTDNRRTSRSTARSANQKHLNSYMMGGGIGAGSLLLHDDVGGPVGPTVNVDGTPMLNDSVDVAGKAYGDSGDSFNHGSGSDLPDGGFYSGIETHHTGSTTW